jgi:hypothetical protein
MLEQYYKKNFIYDLSTRHQFDHVGHNKIAQRLCFIDENSLHWNQDQAILTDVELIEHCRKETGRLPVLCMESNPIDSQSYLKKLQKHIDPAHFFILNSDSRAEQSTQSNIAPWPSCLITQQLTNNLRSLEKKYRIGFLSRVSRFHRLKLLDNIRPYVQPSDIVIANRYADQLINLVDARPQPMATEVARLLDTVPWSTHPEFVDNSDNLDIGSTSHPAFDACVNITGESWAFDDQIFLTEKTWKAYRSGCLVINYGSQHVPAHLEQLGIEIWKEFDVNQCWEDKINKIVELFQLDNIEHIYKQNLEMIQHNQQLVSNREFAQQLAQPAITKIQNLL